MNKKIFILSIILFLFSIIKVNAQDIFKYDWETENQYLEADYTMYYNNNLYFDKGYITTTINPENQDNNGIPKTIINKYDIKGELQETKELTNKMILSLTTDNQYIIALSITYDSSSDIYKILLLDNNLNIKKEIPITLENNEELFYIIEEFKILGIKYLNIINNNIYLLTNDYIKEINIENGTIKNHEVTDNNIKKYMNYLYRLDEEQTETKDFFGYDKKEELEVLTGMDNQGCLQRPVFEEVGGTLKDSIFAKYPIFTDAFIKPYVACEPDYKGTIKLYQNNELIFDKTYDEYSVFSTPYIINKYIVTIGTKINPDTNEYTTKVVILDMKGNIIQEIDQEEYYINLIPGPSSFMTIGTNQSTNNRCYQEEKEISYNCFKNNNIVYYLPLNITTKIEGKGSIDVKETARYEELIKYYPTPGENYILESLNIIDSLNNEITSANNSFIMPDNDITIIARFTVQNPNTGDISIIVLFSILTITSVILIKRKKEAK